MDFSDQNQTQKLGELYSRYRDSLTRLALSCQIPPWEAEDMVQDTFLAYARADYSLDLPEEETARLLSRILRNRCMDYHRCRSRRRWISLEEDGSSGTEEPEDLWEESAETRVLDQESFWNLIRLIAGMPENWKDVAVLRLVQQRPVDEVSRLLQISEKACYARVGRIRRYIQNYMKRENGAG